MICLYPQLNADAESSGIPSGSDINVLTYHSQVISVFLLFPGNVKSAAF